MWVILIFLLAVYFKEMKKIREVASSFQNEWKIEKRKINSILRIVNSRLAGAQKKVDQTQTQLKTFIRGCIIVGCSVRREACMYSYIFQVL